MKHHFLKATTAILALSALYSCSEEVAIDDSLNQNSDQMLERISITGNDFRLDASTRSTVEITNAGVNFLWAENDTVGIFPNTGSQAEFAMDEGAGMQTATFNGGGWALKSSSTYAAYYPYSFYNRNLRSIPVSYSDQTQSGNASTAHLGSYDFMAASVTTPSNGAVSFAMQHMGALVMLQTDLDEAKTLTAVTLSAEKGSFTTTGTIDLTASTPAISAKTSSQTLTIPLADFQVAEGERTTIYFMLSPTNLSGDMVTITLSDEKGEYIKFDAAGKNFAAGTAYAYTLTNGEKFSTPITYNLVDLGLPSGTLWADRNVGADSPESYGDYYAWGETTTKSTYNWSTYKWCQGSSTTQTKYCYNSNYGTVDNKITLDLEDDAAYVNMGHDWRMPTVDEQRELREKCTWTWTKQNGTWGYNVTGPNSNSIFLPAAGFRDDSSLYGAGSNGCYWSSSLSESYPDDALGLDFLSSGRYMGSLYRYYGRSVRAVRNKVQEKPEVKVNKVDLGLPSGTLWADRNVGADSPEAYGDYYAWGETTTKDSYNWSTYKWCQGSSTTQTKYCTKGSYGTVDNKTTLDLEDDAAYVNMGQEWRMPTEAELSELKDKCTWTWTTQNGTKGYKVTGPNSNSIFLPAAGYRSNGSLSSAGSVGGYWSSSLYESYPYNAWSLYFGSSNRGMSSYGYRYYGLSVRAVVR